MLKYTADYVIKFQRHSILVLQGFCFSIVYFTVSNCTFIDNYDPFVKLILPIIRSHERFDTCYGTYRQYLQMPS